MAAARGGSTRPAKSSGKQHRPIKRGRWHPITAIQRPWQAMPLRTRLTLMTTGLLAIGLIVVSFVVTSLLYSHMMGQIDSQLRTTSVAIGSQGLAQILDHVWEYDWNGDAAIVESYISYLRRKVDQIQGADGQPVTPLIQTRRGVGYMLREPKAE